MNFIIVAGIIVLMMFGLWFLSAVLWRMEDESTDENVKINHGNYIPNYKEYKPNVTVDSVVYIYNKKPPHTRIATGTVNGKKVRVTHRSNDTENPKIEIL